MKFTANVAGFIVEHWRQPPNSRPGVILVNSLTESAGWRRALADRIVRIDKCNGSKAGR
jgi:hypothetical protein